MPVVTTSLFRQNMSIKLVDLSNDNFYVALMNNYVVSSSELVLKNVTDWSEVSSFEVTGTNYVKKTLDNKFIAVDGSIVAWYADNITWNNVTVDSYGYCIHRDDGLVVGFVSFAGGKSSAINGTFTIEWDARGIMNLI